MTHPGKAALARFRAYQSSLSSIPVSTVQDIADYVEELEQEKERAVQAERERCLAITDTWEDTKPDLENSYNATTARTIATIVCETAKEIGAHIRGGSKGARSSPVYKTGAEQ